MTVQSDGPAAVLVSMELLARVMTGHAIEVPILKRFRAALDEICGNGIEPVVLFGSRARGDARVASDYDIAVFLETLPDRWAEFNRLSDLCVDFLDDAGVFFDAKP